LLLLVARKQEQSICIEENARCLVAIDDLKVYMDITEEDVEDEYRRAGKLHKDDPEMELKKRYTRVTKKHLPPAGLVPRWTSISSSSRTRTRRSADRDKSLLHTVKIASSMSRSRSFWVNLR